GLGEGARRNEKGRAARREKRAQYRGSCPCINSHLDPLLRCCVEYFFRAARCRPVPGIVPYRPGRDAIGLRSNSRAKFVSGECMTEGAAAGRSKLALWLGAVAGFYPPRPGGGPNPQAPAKFLFLAR